MLKIAICDDDTKAIQTAEKYIDSLANSLSLKYELYIFNDGIKLTEEYPEDLDICFLDVQMSKMDGISAARKIRESDDKVVLVFMSSFAEYAIDGFSVHAYQYLLKPLEYISFKQEMEKIFIKCEKSHQTKLIIKNDEGIFNIDHRDIVYIETYVSKNSLIHVKNRNVVAYASLKELEKRLNNESLFQRCHNSYIVNLGFISYIEKDTLVLRNGESIPLSRHRKKDTVDAYMNYIGHLL